MVNFPLGPYLWEVSWTCFEVIKVECYSGYKVNERPVAFTYKGKRWEVDDIIDRWYEEKIESGQPTMDYFKVRTTEGKEFLLR